MFVPNIMKLLSDVESRQVTADRDGHTGPSAEGAF